MLTERTALILAHIVGEYVDTAFPVGSQTIVQKYGLPISPATVRNEMARLEDEGYITHPHTSAGRIPSDKGYRYYVEVLMEEESLPNRLKRSIAERIGDMESPSFERLGSLEEWARLAATLLAESVQNAAVATSPRVPRCRLQHLEIVSLDETRALLIAVFQGARIRQRVLTLAEAADEESLIGLAHRLTEKYRGATATRISAGFGAGPIVEAQVKDAVCELMEAEEEARFEEAYLDGMLHIFSQPEFAQSDALLEILAALQEGNLPRAIPFDCLASEGVSVVIGAENHEGSLRRCSVILTRYGASGGPAGALAVVGPTRMRYSRVIPTVRYLSVLMGQQLAQLA